MLATKRMDDDAKEIAVAALKRQLRVEELDIDLYRGAAMPDIPGRVFGGQVIAQALASATASIGDARPAHSLHAYFLRAGDNTKPIIYHVMRDFDGGTFANRRVVAVQDGKPILNLAASFQRRESGLSHHADMPGLQGPDDAVPMARVLGQRGIEVPATIGSLLAAFEIHVGRQEQPSGCRTGMAAQNSWFKLHPQIGPELARIALAYASDFGLITTAMLPHGFDWFAPEIQGASLDHAIWFHDEPPLGEWLLYAMDSPWSGNARGISRGLVYDRTGKLVASMAQEGLMRLRPPA